LKCYDEAIKNAPTYSEIRLNREICLAKKERYDEKFRNDLKSLMKNPTNTPPIRDNGHRYRSHFLGEVLV
jgi:hypothetical protein